MDCELGFFKNLLFIIVVQTSLELIPTFKITIAALKGRFCNSVFSHRGILENNASCEIITT